MIVYDIIHFPQKFAFSDFHFLKKENIKLPLLWHVLEIECKNEFHEVQRSIN